MTKVRKIAKNALVTFAGAVAASGLLFLSNIFIARSLGVAGYGLFQFALSLIYLFAMFGDLGLAVIAIREIAKNEQNADKYFGNIFLARLIISVLIFFLSLVLVRFFSLQPVFSVALVFFMVAGLFYMIHIAIRWVFQAFQIFEYEAFLNFLYAALIFAASLSIFFMKRGVLALSLSWILINLSVLAFALIFASKFVKVFKLGIDPKFLKGVFVQAFPVGMFFIVNALYSYLDKVLLFQFKGAAEVGLYGISNKLFLFIRNFFALYFAVVLPALSNFSVAPGGEYFIKLLRRSFDLILMACLPIAVFSFLLASPMIVLMFGKGYEAAAPSLMVFVIALPLACLSGLLIYSLISYGKQMTSFIVVLSGFAINLVLNIIFIPVFGFMAASFSVLFAEVVMFFAVVYLSFKQFSFRPDLLKIAQISAAVIFSGTCVLLMRPFNIFLNLGLSSFIYCLGLFLFKAIDQDDLALLRKIYLGQI